MSSDDATKKLAAEGFYEQLRESSSPIYAFDKRLRQFEEQVAALDEKVDRRLHDTRPIWEGVLAEVREIRADMTSFNDRLEVLVQDVSRTRAEYRSLERRLQGIEAKS